MEKPEDGLKNRGSERNALTVKLTHERFGYALGGV